jgi:hypothetical protein
MNEIKLGFWEGLRNDIHNHLIKENINTFQNWREIQLTMIAGVDNVEYEYLLNCKNWSTWKNKLSENILKPNSHPIFNQSSTNNLHHAYSLQILMEETNCVISDFGDVVEFGGGYGNVCRLFKQWGHNKMYYLYDIMELTQIQKYYLSENNIINNVVYKNGLDNIDNIENNSLFIGMWSLSEVPIEERYKLLENLGFYKCKNIFLAMGGMFQNENNIKWLNDIVIPRLISLGYDYKLIRIEHGKDMFYFVSTKKYN